MKLVYIGLGMLIGLVIYFIIVSVINLKRIDHISQQTYNTVSSLINIIDDQEAEKIYIIPAK